MSKATPRRRRRRRPTRAEIRKAIQEATELVSGGVVECMRAGHSAPVVLAAFANLAAALWAGSPYDEDELAAQVQEWAQEIFEHASYSRDGLDEEEDVLPPSNGSIH